MKRILLATMLFIGFAFNANAQENALNKGLGLGFQLSQYHRDFGWGFSVTSPHFLHDKVAVRLRGNQMYLEHLKDAEVTWTPYKNLTLGLAGVGGYVTENIRLYGEGGVVGMLPNKTFSDEDLALGGYGLFGFEFFMQPGFNYFIEIGGVGSGATADKLPTKPIYSNGLTISTGFRGFLN